MTSKISKSSKLTNSIRRIKTKQNSLSAIPDPLELKPVRNLKSHPGSFASAPVAVSMSPPGFDVVYLPSAPGFKRCRIRGTLCSIGGIFYSTIGTFGAPNPGMLVRTQATVGASILTKGVNTLLLAPARCFGYFPTSNTTHYSYDAYMTSANFLLESLSHTRYRACSDLRIDYLPTSSTADTSTGGVTPNIRTYNLCFTQDPAHPVVGAEAYFNNTMPDSEAIASGSNYVTFAGWCGWSRSFPVDQRTKFYTYNQAFATSDPASTILRNAHFGALTCVSNYGNFVSSANNVLDGRLVITMDIEFSDPFPFASVATAIPVLVNRLGLTLASPTVDTESKSQIPSTSDDDDYNVAPPAFAGAPSATPSGVRAVVTSSSSTGPPVGAPLASAAAPKVRGGWL